MWSECVVCKHQVSFFRLTASAYFNSLTLNGVPRKCLSFIFFSTSSAFALLSSIFLCIIYIYIYASRNVDPCGQQQIMFGTEFVWVHWDLHFAQTAILFGRRLWMIELYYFRRWAFDQQEKYELVNGNVGIWTLSRWITLVVTVRRKRNRASDYYMHNQAVWNIHWHTGAQVNSKHKYR